MVDPEDFNGLAGLPVDSEIRRFEDDKFPRALFRARSAAVGIAAQKLNTIVDTAAQPVGSLQIALLLDAVRDGFEVV